MLNYFLKHTEKIKVKRGFCSRVRLGESIRDNTSLKRKIGKKNLLTYLKKVKKKHTKNKGSAPWVRLG